MRSPVTVTKKGPGLAKLMTDLNRIRNSDVLVGIPAPTTLRKNDPINNASLLFIHTKGSPLRNIPPRPVLEPGIEGARALIVPHLGASAQAIARGHAHQAEQELRRVGTIAANAVKRYFTEGALAPNAPSTIARKGSDRPLINTGQMRRAVTFILRIHS